ncbi:trypco2 family protein [Actinacidiphila glaucinigra]|uniref:trypco2 family protein n=1 Tax=Actinacidiphila glaucinigra TaxID=235986 RepID=UPI0033E2C26D
MESISLSSALEELRQELYKAQDAGSNQQFRFEVEKAELELQVQFHVDGSGKAKVSLGTVGLEVGGGVKHSSTHRLLLTLNVRDEAAGGDRARISDQRRHAWSENVTASDSGAQKQASGGVQPRPWDQ